MKKGKKKKKKETGTKALKGKTTRKSKTQRLLDDMEEKFGVGKVQTASKSDCSYLLRRPCGIFSLDQACAGGLPAASMCEIVGPESIGKNYLANKYIEQCQQIYGKDAKVFIAVTEYKYDKLFARKSGVQISLSEGELKELEEASKGTFSDEERKLFKSQIGEVVLIQGLSAEDTLQASLDLIKTDEYHIGIFDSMGALQPTSSRERELSDPNRMRGADRASLQTEFMHQFYYAIGKKCLFIILNQVRAPIGQWVPPGREAFKVSEAHAIKHGLAARIMLTAGGLLVDSKKKSLKDMMGNPVGKYIRWEILKGKKGFHEGAHGRWEYKYRSGVDILADFVNVAIQFAERSGPYYTFMDEKFQGRAALAEHFQNNPEAVEKAKDYIYQKKGIIFKWHG